MKQIRNNTLKKNFSSWAIFSIINNTKLKEKPVFGWRLIGGKKVTVELFIRVIRKFRNEFIIRAVNPDARKVLSGIVAGTDNLNLYLPDDLVLFQSSIKAVDDNGDIVISIPEMIAQIDRRKHLRLLVENDIRSSISFDKKSHGQRENIQKFSKKCFDISAGGLSFIVSKTESKYFEVGDKIVGIDLSIGERSTRIQGTIVNILEIEPDENNGLHYKVQKVCIRYNEPTPIQQKVINEYVFKYVNLDDAI